MRLEVLLSTMNLNKKDLNKMNITSKCTVINQTNKEGYTKYKNFDIYSYNEKGLSRSRNRGLEKVTGDIIILCDDDVVYNKDYEKNIINEFMNNPKADVIFFNIDNPFRMKKINKKNKRLHFYNSLKYGSVNIAFKRKCIKNIRFNELFGAGSKYSNGEDSLFIKDLIKNKYKLYSSNKYIAKISDSNSTWFNGFDEKYFFDKGALFTALNYRFRKLLMLQYLLRHKYVLTDYKINDAYKIMKKGSIDYIYEKD